MNDEYSGEVLLGLHRNLTVDRDPYSDASFGYAPRDAVIKGSDGKVVETIKGSVFPAAWEENASNTAVTKYFRRADVPGTGREVDVRQMAGRVGKKIAAWGVAQGYFDERARKILEEELVASTVLQHGAFNSPVWFNLGLDLYGLERAEDAVYVDTQGKPQTVTNVYAHPQISACFISSPGDSIREMIKVGAVTSAAIFKRGSGIGGDWSHIRSAGEPVSGGGVASGAKRFMDVQDTSGRVIKSGGISRRAATMQSIGIWHPDMLDVIRDKYAEDVKARILLEAGSPSNWESHTFQNLRGQNVNISIRIDDEFWKAYEADREYAIRRVSDNGVVKRVPARQLLEQIAFATHGCGDPGVQNHTVINRWNTCKNSGEIWASNPCSEYMFLDNSACNLASLNLMKFRKEDGSFDIDAFSKEVDMYVLAQDIMVSQASYPTEEIALNSHRFRPLGLGYANLGAFLMSNGIPYDSDEARAYAAAITANLTAEAYLQSTRLAEKLGPFQEFQKNKDPMLEVIEMHRKAAKQIPATNGLESLVNSAVKKWDEVVERGRRYGFRNAQVTLLAPTGTIGIMMDCDTTGGEPVYVAKAYKELAGGGFMMIVNKAIPTALKSLGYDSATIARIVEYVDKNDTIEGAPGLKEEHLPVFDCAKEAGKGVRSISPMGHVKMLAAIQPHVSGAMSKTINCPESTTVEDIGEMFYQGWKLGVKALAIYRDGSKASQPLKSKRYSGVQVLKRGEREPLPDQRFGITQKVKVGGTSLFLRTGEYLDGRLGELFIDSLERGTEVNRLLHENATQFSEKLQYGTSLREALEIFGKAGVSQIAGMTTHPFIKTTKGIEGFIFDWISAHYLGDISMAMNEQVELRPLPWELRVYQQVPKLHLMPSVAGEGFYPGVPTLEETIKRISGTNFWCNPKIDAGLDTRRVIEKIRRTRAWKNDNNFSVISGKITGRICDKCGTMMISDGSCSKCPSCKTSTGGCGGG